MAPTPTLTLAQLDQFIAPEMPALPSPSMVDVLLFEHGWLLPLTLGVLALVLFFGLSGRAKRGVTAAVVLSCLMLSAGSFILNRAITTPRETVRDNTRDLVGAVAVLDFEEIGRLTHDQLEGSAPQVGASFSKEDVMPGGMLEDVVCRVVQVSGHGIPELNAVIDGPNSARSQVAVWVDGSFGRTGSQWAISWRLEDGEWLATKIEPIWIQGW